MAKKIHTNRGAVNVILNDGWRKYEVRSTKLDVKKATVRVFIRVNASCLFPAESTEAAEFLSLFKIFFCGFRVFCERFTSILFCINMFSVIKHSFKHFSSVFKIKMRLSWCFHELRVKENKINSQFHYPEPAHPPLYVFYLIKDFQNPTAEVLQKASVLHCNLFLCRLYS